MSEKIEVSVICITYNQVQYIRQCLDGFVMQQTNFRFEVIVHDDASTDGTQEIIAAYAKQYPEIIKPILQPENVLSQGKRVTWGIAFPQTQGKYIALCEGDDYWSSPHKLQKQYDFLEVHPECVFCTHQVRGFDDASSVTLRMYPSIPVSSRISGDQLALLRISNETLFQTSSYFMRRSAVEECAVGVPKFWSVSKVGDVPLVLFLAQKGDCGYLPEEMSHYRMNALGSWTARNNANYQKTIRARVNRYNMFAEYDLYTGGKYTDTIAATLHTLKIQINALMKCHHVAIPDLPASLGQLTVSDKLSIAYQATVMQLKQGVDEKLPFVKKQWRLLRQKLRR